MAKSKSTYQDNFRTGVRMLIADKNEVDSVKAAAAYLGFNYMTLHKIMDGSNNPTPEQIRTLCSKAGLSANWLLLSIGEPKIKDAITIEQIAERLNSIDSRLKTDQR